MAAPEKERAPWPRLAVVVLIVGGSLSVLAGAIVFQRETRQIERDFEGWSRTIAQSIEHHVAEQVGHFESVRAFWKSSHNVEPEEFKEFAGDLLEQSVGIESIAWVPRIAAAEREATEALLRKQVNGPVALHAWHAAAIDSQRSQLFPVWYLEPSSSTNLELGLDVGSFRGLEQTLSQPTIGNRVIAQRLWPTDGDAPAGARVVVLLPVPQPVAPDATEALDPATEEGFVVGIIRVHAAVDKSLSYFGPSPVADVLIFDAREKDPAALLYQLTHEVPATGVADPASSAARDLTNTQPLLIGTEHWCVTCVGTAGFVAHRRGALPWVLLGSGLALSALLAFYIRSVEHRTRSLTKSNAGLYTEIAERHAIDKELRETQRALATLVANLPGLAYRCRNDKDWSMEFISDGSIPLTGYPPSDFLRSKVSFGNDVIHEGDRERVWDEIQQALSAQRPFQINYRIVTAFGDEKWVWEQGRGVFSRAGELLAIEGFIIDVTERRKIEDSLRREKAYLDATIESLPGNFYVFDERGKMLRWNQTVERVTGYSKAEVGRMNPLDFFGPEDQQTVANAVAQCFETGATTVEADLLTKSGVRLPYYFTGVRFEYQNVRMLVGLGLDVSERKRAIDERARLQATLLQTQKLESLGVLAGAIAHDFNNLMTVVMGNAGLAQRSLAPGSAAHEFIEQALGASKDASHLTRKLRDYADLKAHAKTELDLSGQVHEFAGLLRTSVPRNVRLEFELAEKLPALTADPSQMQQLLMNLVVNAAESYGERSGVVRISTGSATNASPPRENGVTIRGEPRAGPHVFLAVRDEGDGLDAATLARIGEPFFTTKINGRGLGLAAVLGILREHEGWLEVDSSPGRGSLLRACLPLAPRTPGTSA